MVVYDNTLVVFLGNEGLRGLKRFDILSEMPERFI